MDHAFPAPAPAVAPPRDMLRQWLCAAQLGDAAGYEALLCWAVRRGRERGAPEADLRRALILLDRLRHTYDARRCPLRWIDAILERAGGSRARRS